MALIKRPFSVNDENKSSACVNASKNNFTRNKSVLGNIKNQPIEVTLPHRGKKILNHKILKKDVTKVNHVVSQSTIVEELDTVSSFSSMQIPHNVMDIDKAALGKFNLCSEFAGEVFEYLRQFESRTSVQKDFMKNQKFVTARMRTILIDWLVQVHHRFGLLTETLYLTVTIIDRYLEQETIRKDDFQLLGITALLIASKFEEMYYPEVKDLIHVTENAYSRKTVLQMEIKVLQTIQFCVGCPLPIHFLRRLSRASNSDIKAHAIAKYLMEITLVDSSLSFTAPSLIAATASFISNTLLHPKEFSWDAQMVFYSGYRKDEIKPLVYKLCYFLLNKSNKFQALKKKYADKKNLKASTLPELNSPVLQSWAKLHPLLS